MADDYNLLNNFLDELRKNVNEENERETRSLNAQEFVAHLVSQASMEEETIELSRISETELPIHLIGLSMLGLSAFIGATLDDWFEVRVTNWKDVSADVRKELFWHIASHICTAFLFAGDDS